MVFDRLKRTFRSPEYALIRGVPESTATSTRTADAIVMGLWPSRGLHLAGVEIKCSRNDWLRELKNPDKAEQIARLCDKWWIAIPDARIVLDGELPDTWGLILCGEKRNKILRPAPLLEAMPMTRQFLAAILRRVWEQATPEGQIRKAVDAQLDSAVRAARADGAETERARHEEVEHALERFREASGIDPLRTYDLPMIGHIIKVARTGDGKSTPALSKQPSYSEQRSTP